MLEDEQSECLFFDSLEVTPAETITEVFESPD